MSERTNESRPSFSSRGLAKALAAAMLLGIPALAASPAAAQQQDNRSSIDRMSDRARTATGVIYRAAGTRACGSACGRAAERVGVEIFDQSRRLANSGGARLQEVGRSARERLRRRDR